MKKLFIMVLAVAVAGMLGCAKPVHKIWEPTGGSRADATVELSFEYYEETEKPILDDQAALGLAVERCKAWGYTDAQAFGGTKTQSYVEEGVWGIKTRKLVTKTYQCIGQGSETPHKK